MDNDAFVTPGQLIAQQIKAIGLTQKAVAAIAGIDPAILSRVIKSARPVDSEIALKLEAATGIKAMPLLEAQLKKDFLEAKAKFTCEAQIKAARAVYESAPVQELIRRGWLSGIKNPTDVQTLATKLKAFYGVQDLTTVCECIAHAAKKTNELDPVTPSQAAWITRARQVASQLPVCGTFDRNKLPLCLHELKAFLSKAESVSSIASILSGYGIRLVFVEKLKSAKIDGACFWINNNQEPVIAMSLRFDRIDNFWFVLLHELEHLKNNDGKSISVDDIEHIEDQANQAFRKFIDPNSLIIRCLKAHNGLISTAMVAELAKNLKIHPGLVTGQIQFQTKRYFLFRQYLVPIRDYLIHSGKHIDGWT